MAKLILGEDFDSFKESGPLGQPVQLGPEIMANYRPTREEARKEWDRNKDKRWTQRVVDFVGGMANVGEYWDTTWKPALENDEEWAKGLTHDPDAYKALGAMAELGTRDLTRIGKMIIERGLEPDTLTDDQKFENHFQRQNDFYNYFFDVREQLAENMVGGKFTDEIKAGADILDASMILPSAGVLNKTYTAGIRKSIKGGVGALGYAARAGEKGSQAIHAAARFPKKITGTSAWNIAQTVGATAFVTGTGGAAVAAPAILGLTEILSKMSMKVNKSVADVASVFAKPSSHERFLFRLAKDPKVSEKTRKLATRAYKLQGTKLYDVAFDALVAGTSTATLQAAIQYAAGFGDEQAGMAAATGGVIGSPIGAIGGPRGSGKDPNVETASGKATARTNRGVKEFLQKKNQSFDAKSLKDLAKKSPKSAALLTTLDALAPVEGLRINILDLDGFTDYLNTLHGTQMTSKDAPAAHYDRNMGTITLNENQLELGVDEAAHIFAHELGHHFIKQRLGEDVVAKRLLLEPFHDPAGEDFHFMDDKGQPIPGMPPVTLNAEAVNFANRYADRIEQSDPAQASLITRDAGLLAEELGADIFAMHFSENSNVFDMFQPKIRNRFKMMGLGAMRKALSRFGLVNEKTGEARAPISPDMKIPKGITDLYKNYIKQSAEMMQERANAVDSGRKIFPKPGQTTDSRFNEVYGGLGWGLGAGDAFRVRDEDGFNQVKAIIEKDTVDLNEKNTGLGRDYAAQNLSPDLVEWFVRNSSNPDQTRGIIEYIQNEINNRFLNKVPYRGANKKNWSDYNPFFDRTATLMGWVFSPKSIGKRKDKATGRKIKVFPNLKVRAWDYDVIAHNIDVLARAGMLKKYGDDPQQFTDALMQHSKKAFKERGPEDPINPMGMGENELFAMAFGIDTLTMDSLKESQHKQFWADRQNKGIRSAIKEYDVSSLGGLASTGKDGIAVDYYNARDNYFPSASLGHKKQDSGNYMPSTMYIKGEKFMGKQQASPFEQKFMAGKPVYFGGRFFDVDTGRDITGKTYSGMQIGSKTVETPGGPKHVPVFDVSNIESALPTAPASKVGSSVKINLIDGRDVKTGKKFKWVNKFENIDKEWLISFDHAPLKSKKMHPEKYDQVSHAFALSGESMVPINLRTLSNEDSFYGPESKRAGQLKSNPRGRPLMKGDLELGKVVGEIEMNGKLRPVYDKVTVKPREGSERLYMPKSDDHGLLGVVEQGEILYSKTGDLWMMDHHRRSVREPEGHSWRYREKEQAVYWWNNKPTEVDKESVAAHLERKGYKVKRNKVLDGNSPTFEKDYEAAHAFKLMAPPKKPKKGEFMPYVGTPQVIKPEPGYPLGKMSTEFIGSGEGRHAFGWGLYFADSFGIADWYRQTYSEATYDGEPYNANNPRHAAAKYLAEYTRAGDRDRKSAIDTLEMNSSYESFGQPYLKDGKIVTPRTREYRKNSKEYKNLQILKEGNEAKIEYSGSVYDVKLAPNETELMLWDTPFSRQHPEVQQKLLDMENNAYLLPFFEQDATGGQIYEAMTKKNGYVDSKQASMDLLGTGIRGNKYYDGNSRFSGLPEAERKHNYVIWDDKDVEIVKKNFMPKLDSEGPSKSNVKAKAKAKKPGQASNIAVAALRNQVIRDIPHAQQLAQQQYHRQFLTNNKKIAEALGADIVEHGPVIGGWKDTDNFVLNRENSHRLAINFGRAVDKDTYAALVGALAPELQNSVLVTTPNKAGVDRSVSIQLENNAGEKVSQLEFLDQYGLAEGFTYDPDNNRLIFDIKTAWQATGFASVQKLYKDLVARGDASSITSFKASVSFPEVKNYRSILSPARIKRHYRGDDWKNLRELASQALDRLKYQPRKSAQKFLKRKHSPTKAILEKVTDKGRKLEHPILKINNDPIFLDKNRISRDMGKMQTRGWNQFEEVNAEADLLQTNMADAGLGPVNWPKVMGLRTSFSGETEIPVHPATLYRWVMDSAEFQSFWKQKVAEDPAYLNSAMQGLKAIEPTYAMANQGKLPEHMVALNSIWGVFSISAAPVAQESGWSAFTNDAVAMQAVWDSINGKFKMDKDTWIGHVSNFLRSAQDGGQYSDIYKMEASGHGAFGQMPHLMKRGKQPFAGNSVTMNANSSWNTMRLLNGRWDEFTGMLNDSSLSGNQIRDEFFKAGFAGASIGPKILSFIISTLGRNDLVIIDRWQLINFWSDFLQQQQGGGEIFNYDKDGTPVEKTAFYDNYAKMIAGTKTTGQATFKAVEVGLRRILSDNKSFLDPIFAQHGLQPSIFGLHWNLWNFIKMEAVGHSSLDVTQKYLLNNQYPKTDADFPVFQQSFANEQKFTDEIVRDKESPTGRKRRRHYIDKAGAKPRVVESIYR